MRTQLTRCILKDALSSSIESFRRDCQRVTAQAAQYAPRAGRCLIGRGLAKRSLAKTLGGRTKRPRVVKESQPSCPPAPMTKYRAKLSGQRAPVPATKVDA